MYTCFGIHVYEQIKKSESIYLCLWKGCWKCRDINSVLYVPCSVLKKVKRDLCNGRMLIRTASCSYVVS